MNVLFWMPTRYLRHDIFGTISVGRR
jgi:hypothetical protein